MNPELLDKIRQVWPSYERQPDFLNTDAAAAVLGYSRQTLAIDRCGARRWKYTKVGVQVRYAKLDLAMWLLANSSAPVGGGK